MHEEYCVEQEPDSALVSHEEHVDVVPPQLPLEQASPLGQTTPHAPQWPVGEVRRFWHPSEHCVSVPQVLVPGLQAPSTHE